MEIFSLLPHDCMAFQRIVLLHSSGSSKGGTHSQPKQVLANNTLGDRHHSPHPRVPTDIDTQLINEMKLSKGQVILSAACRNVIADYTSMKAPNYMQVDHIVSMGQGLGSWGSFCGLKRGM